MGEIGFDTSRPDGTPRKLLDVSRLTTLGWQAHIGLKEGIAFTYQWLERELTQRQTPRGLDRRATTMTISAACACGACRQGTRDADRPMPRTFRVSRLPDGGFMHLTELCEGLFGLTNSHCAISNMLARMGKPVAQAPRTGSNWPSANSRPIYARRPHDPGQRVEVNTALSAVGRECPAGIAGPRRRACGGA
jgi:hypothetical protein